MEGQLSQSYTWLAFSFDGKPNKNKPQKSITGKQSTCTLSQLNNNCISNYIIVCYCFFSSQSIFPLIMLDCARTSNPKLQMCCLLTGLFKKNKSINQLYFKKKGKKKKKKAAKMTQYQVKNIK